jgi:hypothetical protein
VLTEELRGNVYFPPARAVHPGGASCPWWATAKPALAKTLRRLAKEGPDDFITGEWARQFVAEGNRLGWPIEMKHMSEVPPRWGEPHRFTHRGHEVLQLSPPDRQGVFCALVLGILRHLDLPSLGHYAKSAESLYYFAHALRWAEFEMGYLWDPRMFEVPSDLWLSDDHHRHVAQMLKRSRPRVDLTEHVKLTSGKAAMVAAGLPVGAPDKPPTYKGSCELSIVDEQGNWVQMMNTLQSGGIPGAVVGGAHDGQPRPDRHEVGHRGLVHRRRTRASVHRQHHRPEGRQALALARYAGQRARHHPRCSNISTSAWSRRRRRPAADAVATRRLHPRHQSRCQRGGSGPRTPGHR